VRESFNRRAIDDPTAFCLAPGVPRVNSVGLFPMQIFQTPQAVVMLYEYMNVYRTACAVVLAMPVWAHHSLGAGRSAQDAVRAAQQYDDGKVVKKGRRKAVPPWLGCTCRTSKRPLTQASAGRSG
jgi:hypothetical protein